MFYKPKMLTTDLISVSKQSDCKELTVAGSKFLFVNEKLNNRPARPPHPPPPNRIKRGI